MADTDTRDTVDDCPEADDPVVEALHGIGAAIRDAVRLERDRDAFALWRDFYSVQNRQPRPVPLVAVLLIGFAVGWFLMVWIESSDKDREAGR